MQGSRRDSESAGAKNISDVLEIDTKANFQEHNPCKVRFRKSREGGGYGPPCPPPHPLMGHGAFEINKKRSEVWQLNNINIRRVTIWTVCSVISLKFIIKLIYTHMVQKAKYYPEDKILQLISLSVFSKIYFAYLILGKLNEILHIYLFPGNGWNSVLAE